jgi:hypothetical protein
MGIQQTNCVVKSNSTYILTQYVWISNQYINTKNETHIDDDYDNEDNVNNDNDAHQQSFRHSSDG